MNVPTTKCYKNWVFICPVTVCVCVYYIFMNTVELKAKREKKKKRDNFNKNMQCVIAVDENCVIKNEHIEDADAFRCWLKLCLDA